MAQTGLPDLEALSSEFRLVAACCRWPSNDQKDEIVRSLADGRVDWSSVLRIAARQRVEGLVNAALISAKVDLPAEVRARLRGEADRIARQNLVFTAESFRLSRLLSQAQIPFLFVKGVTLAMLAYRTLANKKAWDIDLVVAPDRTGQACAVLIGAGYERLEPGPELSERQFEIWTRCAKETVWVHQQSGAMVELHTRLIDNPYLLPNLSIEAHRREVEMAGGKTLPTLPADELLAYHCVHGASHAWSRLKWIADVAALLSPLSAPDIEQLYRRLLQLGTGRCLDQALLLSATLFETPLAPAFHAELSRDPVTRWLVRVALKTMRSGGGERELDESVWATLPIHISHFVLARGAGYKRAEAKRKMLSPYDRAALDLPRPLHFLYPFMLLPNWVRRRIRMAAAP